jgi:hypothetical protein
MSAIQIVAVCFGGFFALLLLGLVFWRRNLTAAEYTFARILLALAVACAAVLLTGYLNVNYKGAIQAGGTFAVFVLVYFLAPAQLQGTNEWQSIRAMWRGLRDINDDPAQANADDVASALNMVNETARLITLDDSLLKPFSTDYINDYCRIYGKLRKNKYPIPQANSTSDAQLNNATNQVANRLRCQ